MWYNPASENEYKLYQIDKTEDIYRRRFHLKVDKEWMKREYISKNPEKFMKNA